MIYRGANAVPSTSIAEVQELFYYGANLVRFQIAPYPTLSQSEWYNQVLEHTAKILELVEGCESFLGNNWLVELHKPAPEGLGKTIEGWSYIHSQLKDIPAVIAYGLLNEPAMKPRIAAEFQGEIKRKIKPGASGKKVVMSTSYGDPLREPYVGTSLTRGDWYCASMYLPLRVTHQGVYDYPVGPNYPTAKLDKNRLKNYLRYLRKFQLEHKAKILISEFSISQYADEDSRVRYMEDLIEIFHEWEWHWCSLTFGSKDYDVPWQMEGKVLEVLKRGLAA